MKSKVLSGNYLSNYIFLFIFIFLLIPSDAFCYVGPGAGFAFIGSAFVFILTILLAILTLALWPLQLLIRKIRGKGIST